MGCAASAFAGRSRDGCLRARLYVRSGYRAHGARTPLSGDNVATVGSGSTTGARSSSLVARRAVLAWLGALGKDRNRNFGRIFYATRFKATETHDRYTTESHHASLKQVITQTAYPLSLSLSYSLYRNEPQRHAGLQRGTHRPGAHFRRYFCCTNSAPCFDWATLNVTPSLTRPGTWRQKEMWGTVSMPSRPNLYLLMPMPTAR